MVSSGLFVVNVTHGKNNFAKAVSENGESNRFRVNHIKGKWGFLMVYIVSIY